MADGQKQATENAQTIAGGKLYWRCQLGGWLGFGLLQFFPVFLYNNGRMRVWAFLAPILLKLLVGLTGTHLLYSFLRRRQWLQAAGGKLAVRLMVAVALLAAILTASEFLGARLLPQDADGWYRSTDPRRMLLAWIGWMIVLSAWTTLYVMIHEFRERRIREMRALRLEMMVQDAQLRGLRAQLNPHFLFNCLNGLREVIAENPERAQLMVTQLSALLRYSLHSNQSELVPLSEEIQAVKDYLSLETVRFEERLRVEWFMDPGAGRVRVPPMLLQTVVENALKHGIARRPEGGEVTIHARVAGAELQLEVANSGEISHEPSPGAVGLKNAQEQLKLLFGDRASLSLENAGEGRVLARVRLPLATTEVSA
jgi:Histidine kinase